MANMPYSIPAEIDKRFRINENILAVATYRNEKVYAK
jgi:hypothetical protein